MNEKEKALQVLLDETSAAIDADITGCKRYLAMRQSEYDVAKIELDHAKKMLAMAVERKREWDASA